MALLQNIGLHNPVRKIMTIIQNAVLVTTSLLNAMEGLDEVIPVSQYLV
jgi:hypothetical protein